MGRTSVFMVIGFSTIFLFFGKNFADIGVQSFGNAITYYETTQGNAIASAGANLACTQLFQNPNWRDGFQNISFNGGEFDVTVETYSATKVKIVASGTYEDYSQEVTVIMQPSLFSKFAYYSNIEPSGIWWTTGDTVWGPYHSDTAMYVDGTPVFWGKATSKNGIVKRNKYAKPKFYGGYESGVSIELPSDLNTLLTTATSGGKVFNTTDDVYLEFKSDGTVKYKTGSSGSWTTELLSTLTGNGAIVVNGGNVRVQGTIDGRATVAAIRNSGTGGNVYIDDDIIYKDDPRTVSGSTDMLGLVATQEIIITDNTANSSGDINIHASLFALTGGFGAENYATRDAAGQIKLFGGVSQNIRRAVGTFSGSGIVSGFKKSYRYDERLMADYPPAFPTTGSYEIISWLE